MNAPLISVIVPAYNIEAYLPRCLDSLLNQTYQNLEVIVVDDGSSDQTGTIIDRYAAQNSRIIPVHKENGGVSKARITGLGRARGEYIGFTDGDDFVEPEMFGKLIENALNHQADISHCGYKMVFPDGHEDLYYGTDKLVIQSKEQGLNDLLKGDFVEPGLCNKLYSKDILAGFTDSPLWDDDIRLNEDLLMNYLLFKKAGKSVFEDKCYYQYILRHNSAATASIQPYKVIDPLKVIEIIKKDVEKDETLYNIVYGRYVRTLIRNTEQTDYKDEQKKAIRQLRKELQSGAVKKSGCSKKVKMMSIGAAYLPGLYRSIRSLYGKISGVADKYKT
jgi:glycosyltransferase involved in cell wall biosynthesis